MASINQLVDKAHQLGISLEKDIDELESVINKWNRNTHQFSIHLVLDGPSDVHFSEIENNDLREEAWIQEAWL